MLPLIWLFYLQFTIISSLLNTISSLFIVVSLQQHHQVRFRSLFGWLPSSCLNPGFVPRCTTLAQYGPNTQHLSRGEARLSKRPRHQIGTPFHLPILHSTGNVCQLTRPTWSRSSPYMIDSWFIGGNGGIANKFEVRWLALHINILSDFQVIWSSKRRMVVFLILEGASPCLVYSSRQGTLSFRSCAYHPIPFVTWLLRSCCRR